MSDFTERMKSDFPEHHKLKEINEKTQAIGEFIEWVRVVHGAELMVYFKGKDKGWYSVFARRSLEKLLAEWSGIDLDKLRQEKDEILERQRELNRRLDAIQD